MNDKNGADQDAYRTFLLMSELEGEGTLSQRDLAKRLGIAVGLVNSYLKNFVAKGFVRVKTFPRNRYAYLLTPKGLAEKSRLAYQHISYFNNLYKVARHDYLRLFRALQADGVSAVAFCGVDEVAEIAYLSLQETGLTLAAVMDDEKAGSDFFGCQVASLEANLPSLAHPLVITSLKKANALRHVLANGGVTFHDIQGEG